MPFSHSFSKYLLRIYYGLGTVFRGEVTAITRQRHCPHEAYILDERDRPSTNKKMQSVMSECVNWYGEKAGYERMESDGSGVNSYYSGNDSVLR